LDGIMLERVKERFPYGDGGLVTATGLVQRFASPAIAERLRVLLNSGIGKMECASEANLLAYFLRVSPRVGAAMLRRELQAGDRSGCLILRRLAEVRMSPEVEDAALETLNDPNPSVIRNALYVLQRYGSSKTKKPLLRHFRRWHDAWKPRAKELQNPENREQASMDRAYFTSIGAAQGWLCSKKDLQALGELCVTKPCKDHAAETINYWMHMELMIQFSAPVGEEVVGRIGIAHYSGVIGTMDRLKQKMAQYPKGSVFTLDARFEEHEMVEHIYDELKPWAAEHAFDLRKYVN
jgi:hypothetical protein